MKSGLTTPSHTTYAERYSKFFQRDCQHFRGKASGLSEDHFTFSFLVSHSASPLASWVLSLTVGANVSLFCEGKTVHLPCPEELPNGTNREALLRRENHEHMISLFICACLVRNQCSLGTKGGEKNKYVLCTRKQ